MQSICVLKGNITFKRQSHYDVKKQDWVYSEETVVVSYILQSNALGDRAFDVRSERKVPDNLIQISPEYTQIIEPWLQGTLTIHDLRQTIIDYPDRLCFPVVGDIALPPLLEPTKVQVNEHHTQITDQSVTIQQRIESLPFAEGDSIVLHTGTNKVDTHDSKEEALKAIQL